jgi:hypothetical protein
LTSFLPSLPPVLFFLPSFTFFLLYIGQEHGCVCTKEDS